MPVGLLAQIGANAAGAAIDTGMGLMLEKHQDKRQLQQQQKLTDMQLAGQQIMTDYNMKKQLEMWKATSYKAQIEQMAMAGINPGLLYGMSGGGAQTTGNANGTVTGAHAPTGGNEIATMMGMGIQRALLQAQKENIEADTKKKEVETAKTAGVDTTLATTQAQSLTQGIENAKAQQALTNIQTAINSVQLQFDKDTLQIRESGVNLAVSKLNEEINLLSKENLLNAATLQTKINQAKQQLASTILQQWLTTAQTANVQADTRNKVEQLHNMIEENLRNWDKLSIDQQHLQLERLKVEYEQALPPELKELLDKVHIIPGIRK